MLLKYEDMVEDIDGSCRRIAKFLGICQTARFDQNFGQLRSREPTFFRSADNGRNIEELAQHMALFERLHGKLMRELGYSMETARVAERKIA